MQVEQDLAAECERTGHVPFKDRRKPGSDTVCTVCGAVIEKGQAPRELTDIYQPGVTIMLRHEADDDEIALYRLHGATFGEGRLIQLADYMGSPGSVFYVCEFEQSNGQPIQLTLSPAMFMVVEDERTKAILVEAMLKS